MLRSPQTRKSVREDHNQQELSHHAESPEEHHPQKQVQEGPPHGEDACTVLIVSVLDAWWPGRTLYTVKWTIPTKCRSENVGVYWNARFCLPPSLSLRLPWGGPVPSWRVRSLWWWRRSVPEPPRVHKHVHAPHKCFVNKRVLVKYPTLALIFVVFFFLHRTNESFPFWSRSHKAIHTTKFVMCLNRCSLYVKVKLCMKSYCCCA